MSLTVNRLIRRKLRLSAHPAGGLRRRRRRRSRSTAIASRRRHTPRLTAFAQARARGGADQRGGLPPHQSAARRSRPGPVPDHPPGRDRHRARSCSRPRSSAAARDDVGGQRRGPRLRAPGHAGQRLRRPRDPEREAVPRRALGQGRGPRRARRRGHLARHQAAHQGGQLRHPPQQRRRQGSRSSTISEPAAPVRLEVEVGATYLVRAQQGEGRDDGGAPAFVAGAGGARARGRCCWRSPTPRSPIGRGSGSTTTRPTTRRDDEVRTAIYYAFQRHNIEIPCPHPGPVREGVGPSRAPTRSWRKKSGCSPASICSRRCRRSSATRSRSSAPMVGLRQRRDGRPAGGRRPVDVRRPVGHA